MCAESKIQRNDGELHGVNHFIGQSYSKFLETIYSDGVNRMQTSLCQFFLNYDICGNVFENNHLNIHKKVIKTSWG